MYVRKGNATKKRKEKKKTQQFSEFSFFTEEPFQIPRSKANNAIEGGIPFLGIRAFLGKHSLEFYVIWLENAFENK